MRSYWLVSGEEALSDDALVAIGENQEAGSLFVSPITAWEFSLATRKRNNAPQLGTATAGHWFREAAPAVAAKITPINQRVAIEAAEVASTIGNTKLDRSKKLRIQPPFSTNVHRRFVLAKICISDIQSSVPPTP